ncbi:hypothetical protein NS14008_29330 [Nocardia seriolae]|nr:hypothetical protein NS14008_29330 [Nocardia seriolae]PSK27984.1 hypothetical protein C6575_28960 [Nocardia seriolae]RLP27581.1 hypothetical protein D6158_28780 [Nocardia seriolae]BAW09467.1 conserved hypothetical protein [Nocardia seriolae]
MITAAALALVTGVLGAGMAGAHPVSVPATGSELGGQLSDGSLNVLLRDAHRHAGERYSVYGLVYSDAAVWTLAFVSGGPTEFYTIDGSRVELTGPASAAVAQGDVFTGTITLTGRADSGDPVVVLDGVSVIGHRAGDALR